MTDQNPASPPTPPPIPAPVVLSAQWTDSARTVISAVINGVPCFVPADEGNFDYKAIQAWVAKGNVIADPPVVGATSI